MKAYSLLAGVVVALAAGCIFNRTNFSLVNQSATTEGRIGQIQPSDQSMQADKRSELDTAVSTSEGGAKTGAKTGAKAKGEEDAEK